jgi:hypothetical protein
MAFTKDQKEKLVAFLQYLAGLKGDLTEDNIGETKGKLAQDLGLNQDVPFVVFEHDGQQYLLDLSSYFDYGNSADDNFTLDLFGDESQIFPILKISGERLEELNEE